MAEHDFAGAPAVVIGREFVASNGIELAMVRKVWTGGGDFEVMDSNGTIIFKVKRHSFSMHSRRQLLDATGKPLINLRAKIFNMHDKWEAFKGESKDKRDLVFTVKRSKIMQWKTKLHVFLSRNDNPYYEGAPHDYRVECTWSKKSCVIYAGDSQNIVAQMRKKVSFKSWLMGKDNFMVTVYPNVDYALITALIAILDAINSNKNSSGGGGGGAVSG